MSWEIRQGDVMDRLREMPDESVQCVVTSPPYWGLRDYGTAQWEGVETGCDHRQGRPGSGRADGVVDDRMQRNRDGVGSMGGDCSKCGARRVDSQLGLERTPDCGRRGYLRLRADLTDEQREFVARHLSDAGRRDV